MASTGVTYLTRWEDWESVDKLKSMFNDPATQDPRLRPAIAKYFVMADRKWMKKSDLSDSLKHAHECLAEIRREAPDVVNEAEQEAMNELRPK